MFPDTTTYAESMFRGVTVDSSNNIYTVGYASQSGRTDAVYTKYNSAGTSQSFFKIDDFEITGENDQTNAIVLSGDENNAHITGYTTKNLIFGESTVGTWWDRDVDTADIQNTVYLDTDTYVMFAQYNGAAIDGGNLYTSYFGISTTTYEMEGGIIGYDTSNGSVVNQFSFSYSTAPIPLNISLKGDYVYVTGSYKGEAFISKHDTNDNLSEEWFKSASDLGVGDVDNDSNGAGIAIDSSDNVYFTINYIRTANEDYYARLVKLDSNGVHQDDIIIDEGEISSFAKMAITGADELYVGGNYGDAPALFKYDTGLAEIYNHNLTDDEITASNPMYDGPADITIDGNGDIILAGAMDGKNMWIAKYSETSVASTDDSLSNLTVSPGTLDTAFDSNTYSYSSSVSSNVTSVDVTATLSDSSATLTIDGESATSEVAKTVNIGSPGTVIDIDTVVTAEDGVTQSTYTITVSRESEPSSDASLSGLTVDPGTLGPSFDYNTYSYSTDVSSNVTSVDVTATLSDSSATLTINGENATSGSSKTINLGDPGNDTVIDTLVTAEDGITQSTYTITVTRTEEILSDDAYLSNLTVDPGSLDPVFYSNTYSYSTDVSSNVTSVDVTATLSDFSATLTINGKSATSGAAETIILGDPGTDTDFNTVVTAADGNTTNTYSITVSRAAENSEEDEEDEIDSDEDEYVKGGKKGYVNPDNGEKADIHFKANDSGYVDYTIYSLTGKKIDSGRKYTEGGDDYIEWAATNFRDNVVQSGIYIIQLNGPGVDTRIKIPVLR